MASNYVNCPICSDIIRQDDEWTTCQIGKSDFHRECAGVTELSPNFGCIQCLEVSGNVPRRRVREDKNNEVDRDEADDGASKVQADLRTSSQKLQKSNGGDNDNESRKDKSAGALNRSQDSASSQRSRRDEIMLKMLEQHAQMLKELASQRTG